MNKYIPLSVPNLCGNELKYVEEIIKTNWVSTAGSYITKLEQALGKYINSENVIMLQSGTAGIHLCLIDSKVSHGDEVIVPTLTFIATINPIRYVGANPVFIDCDDSLCLNPISLQNFLLENTFLEDNKCINKISKAQIKAIIVPHIFGNISDMEKIMIIAQKYNLIVIEDAAESVGSKFIDGKYKDMYAGTIGDYGVFSFNGNKIITTGGGGAVTCKLKSSIDHMKYLSTQAKDDEVYFIHNEVGYNYRMTNLQAAIGLAQLEMLDDFITIKKKNYDLYNSLIDKNKYSLVNFKEDIVPNYWFYSLYVKNENISIENLISFLNKFQIQVRPIWKLNHTQLPYINFQCFDSKNAQHYYERIINIPCSTDLKQDEIEYICNLLNNY